MNHYTVRQLQQMKKTDLYAIAKRINKNVPYSASTKQTLKELIINHQTRKNTAAVNESINTVHVSGDTQAVFCDRRCNYNEEYVGSLKDQISYFKEQAHYWRDLYINSLKQKSNTPHNPVDGMHGFGGTCANMDVFMKEFTKFMANVGKEPYDMSDGNPHKSAGQIKVIQTPNDQKDHNGQNEPKQCVEGVSNPWSLMRKPCGDSDKRPIGQRIKEDSLIDYVNSVTQTDIEKMGFKSRKDYYDNQLQLKQSAISLGSVKLKKSNKSWK